MVKDPRPMEVVMHCSYLTRPCYEWNQKKVVLLFMLIMTFLGKPDWQISCQGT